VKLKLPQVVAIVAAVAIACWLLKGGAHSMGVPAILQGD